MAEPTNRCWKSRRTSWNSRLRRSTKFRKKRVPGSLEGTVKINNTKYINDLQRKIRVDTAAESLLQFEVRQW